MAAAPSFDRDRLRQLMEVESERFCAAHPHSLALHERAAARMPLGVPMPWMLAWPGPCPVYVQTAAGALVTDADGNDSIAVRHIMRLTLGFDHRIIDGADAGKFMAELKKTLENWDGDIG